jgi:ADP-L-glycero-D-manno-heptose 6-epimerase
MSEKKIRYTPGGMIDETTYDEDLVNAENIDAPIAATFEEPPRVFTKEEVMGIVHNKVKEMGEKITNSEEGEEVSVEEQEKRTQDFQKIIIVTGGAGFIGTHLIKELNHRGREDILLVDDLTDPRKLQNINTLKFQDYVDKSKFIELLSFLLENKMVERIYHLGAESSRFCTDGKYLMENNYQYTCNIMDHCHMHKIPLVFASSASIYGQSETFDDTSDDYTPESYYALSKLQADRYSRKFETHDQDSIIGLRYFNVFSKGEHEQHKYWPKSVLCWMTEQYEENGVIKLFEGSKEIKRDFVHVTNAVEMTINAMTKGKTGIYNIGTGTAKSFYDMAADVLEKEFSTDESNIKYIPMPEDIAQGYQKFTEANMINACFGITTRP